MSELYKRDTYLNKGIPYVFNTEIYEYDMHHAGISISRELELLPEDILNKIELKARNKKDIAVLLGKIQKSDNDYKEKLKKGFEKLRKRFFELNGIEDEDVLSIKKDAIFVFKPCEQLKFGEVSFILKHVYTSYVNTGPCELYYNPEYIDVKGIDDKLLFFHTDYILDFIRRVFYKIEQEGKESALRYIRVMADQYKRLELDPGYYREFNRESNYKSKDREYIYSDITPMILPSIDIQYNYYNVIIALLKTIL